MEALRSLPGWQALPPPRRELLLAAAAWHDAGKPACTRVENGRTVSPHHARVGARLAHARLYREGVDPLLRDELCGLVRWHQVPLHALSDEKDRSLRRVFRASLACRLSDLALLSQADVLGRRSAHATNDGAPELFLEWARELGCAEAPRTFPSDHSRFVYFAQGGDPDRHVHDDTVCEVVLLSGLPGAGKDTWIGTNLAGWPVVSLDQVRSELEVDPEDDQGALVQYARELCREHLRVRRAFALNATSLVSALRERWIRLFSDYRARVRIVALEVPYAELLRRNRARGKAGLPCKVLESFIDRWEPPALSEAHAVTRIFG